MLGWSWHDADPEARKSFEVAVHAGGAAALLIGQRRLIASELRAFDARRAAVVALSFAVPAVAGLLWERQIEERLGGPAVDRGGAGRGLGRDGGCRRPRRRTAAAARRGRPTGSRSASARRRRSMPGVSRNGATLTAARSRRFTREQSNLLSRTVALPVIAGAAALKGYRLTRRGVDPGPATGDGGRRRGLVRVHVGLAAADRPRRERPSAVALRGLPGVGARAPARSR